MQFSLSDTINLLERTPGLLDGLLNGLPDDWTQANEGPETFSPFDVVGHLLHGERTDWLVRAKIILEQGPARPFDPYDRFAQYEESRGKSLEQLLAEFRSAREQNLAELRSLNLQDSDLAKTGTHPALGTVTLQHLLACWAVHDLSHLAQIARVMAKQYKNEVGPWQAYLPILGK